MKILRKNFDGGEIAIDWSEPVVVFDPWPFEKNSVALAGLGWFLSRGELKDGPDWSLCTIDNVLGTATDGRYVVGSLEEFEALR